MNQARTNQGGSVAPFIIGAIILLVIAVGAMMFLHQRTSTDPTASPVATHSPSVSVSPSASPNQSQSSSPTKTPTSSPTPTVSPQPAQPGRSDAQSQTPTDGSGLPATGPSDMMPMGILVAVAVGFAVSFIRSRMDKRALGDN